MERYSCDVFVLGAGGAGLRAAVEAEERGAEVLVASKSLPGKSHTAMAEGGFGAALGNADPADSVGSHFRDTFEEGCRINHPEMVEILVEEAPERLRELEGWGCLFDRDGDGRVRQREFGGHSHPRACHFGDKTGLEMVRTLQYRAMEGGIGLIDEAVFLDLLMEGGEVRGAVGLELRSGEAVAVEAGAVVLATGGCGRVFKVTSNSWESTGDGYGMAYRAGAELQDMEMVQFHPTGMLHPEGVKGKLVTEAVRGEGGVLLNSDGERFMERYAPDWMELAPRDVVSRAIYSEVEAGRGTERGGVLLDATVIPEGDVEERLPAMVEQFRDLAGVDITEEAMEVAPTAHYMMGGVRVEPESCATTIPGLYAAGEVASGVHGANRLGTNSLSDIVVFGRRAGEAAARYAEEQGGGSVGTGEVEEAVEGWLEPLKRADGEDPFDLAWEMREAMWREMGIVREGEGLEMGIGTIEGLRSRAENVSVPGDSVYNQAWVESVSLRNLLTVARLMLVSALEREESRGAHFRSDFPETREEWRCNVVCRRDGEGVSLRRETVPEASGRAEEWLEEAGDDG